MVMDGSNSLPAAARLLESLGNTGNISSHLVIEPFDI